MKWTFARIAAAVALVGVLVAGAGWLCEAGEKRLFPPPEDDVAAKKLEAAGARVDRYLTYWSPACVSFVQMEGEVATEKMLLIASLPKCNHVSFRNARFEQIEDLDMLADMTPLKTVSIEGSDFGDDELVATTRLLRQMPTVFLDRTSITDRSILLLASMPYKSLVAVRETAITPDGVAYLRKLRPDMTVWTKPGALQE